MTLQAKFDQELTKLGKGAAATVAVSEGHRDLSCDVTDCNQLGVSFNYLRVATPELGSATPAELERIGKVLSERLTYLMEPIAPIELDSEACIVQLRSNPPQRDDDGRSYYELTVSRGGQISLGRYRKDNGNARQPIVATVTREVMTRLVGDFCAVL
jgi:hypothetical protein